MDLLETIHNLPKIEKIKMMEFLWNELTTGKDDYTSPEWHKDALKDTEKRVASGDEEFIEWNEYDGPMSQHRNGPNLRMI